MKGILLALVGAWLGGLAIPGIKYFLSSVDPFHLIVVSNIGAIVFLLLFKKIFSPGFKPFPRRELLYLVWALVLGSGFAVPLAIMGMVTVSGTVSGLLFNLETVFTFYLASLIFKERLGGKAHVAMVCVVVGGLFSAFGGPVEGAWMGMTFLVFSCLMFAIQTNILKKIESQDSFSMTIIEFSSTFVVAFIVSVFLQRGVPEIGVALKLMFLGICTYAFGNVLFYQSLKRLGAGRTATIYGSAPLLGAASSIVLLGEPVTPLILIGFSFVLIGLLILLWEKHAE